MRTEIFSLTGKTPRILFAVLLLAITTAAGLTAADDMTSREQISYIKSVVERYAKNKENMADERVKASIRKEIGGKLVLRPTKRVLDSGLRALSERARQLHLKNNKLDTNALQAKFRKEADATYTMYKLRDQVSVQVRRGNLVSTVQGIFYRVTRENVMIGNKTVYLRDLDEFTRSKFDKALNQHLKDEYVARKIEKAIQENAAAQQKIFRQLLEKQNSTNEKNGYIYLDRDSRWVTAEQVVNYYLREEERTYLENRAREARLLAERQRKEAELAQQRAAEEQRSNPESERPAARNVPAEGEQPAAPQSREQRNTAQRRERSGEVVDMFAGTGSELPKDTGGDFIAMSPQDLAEAMRKRAIGEDLYKDVMKIVDSQTREIGANYWGIDADQGYKKALWGFTETQVYVALSKEKDIAFLEKHSLNRSDIIFPKGSRPAKVSLYYFFGKLNELQIFMGVLKEREFKIFKDGLNAKYGSSTTQMKHGKEDIFYGIQKGNLAHDRLPVVLPEAEQKKYTEQGASQESQASNVMNLGQNTPYVVVWEGRISRGVLIFNYDIASGLYSNVVFHKKCFPERLDADRKKRAEAAKKAAAAKNKKKAEAKKAPTSNTGSKK